MFSFDKKMSLILNYVFNFFKVHNSSTMLSIKKKSVVFTASNDLLLMKEVAALDPYGNPDRWVTVAENLTRALNLEKAATKRTVQERMDRLLKKWKSKERESQKKYVQIYADFLCYLPGCIDV